MAWMRGWSGVLAVAIGGCAAGGDDDLAQGSEEGSSGEVAAETSGAGSGAGGTGTAGGLPGSGSGTDTDTDDPEGPVQCEGADDGWGGGDEGETSGGDDGDGSGGGTFGMDDDMPLATNVYDVQMGGVMPGELVAMSGLVATTPSSPSETGAGWELFVQDLQGGPFSGLRVRVPSSDPGELVSPGDELALVGRLRMQDGFYLVEIVGTGAGLTPGDPVTPPEPELVPAEILDPENPDARPYEGVPVRIEQVVVIDADPCAGELQVGEALRVDDRFAPDALPELPEGATIVAIEGILVWALDAYGLAPTGPDAFE